MKLAIVGSGYVGLTSSVCFASRGHNVTCIDIDKKKVDMINSGVSPIFEKGMNELLKDVLKKGLLKATIDAKTAIKNSEVIFICVGTPSKENGDIDLKYIESATKTISENLNNYKIVVVKSTVVPGTTMKTVKPILDKANVEYGLCMNPEFLKEGMAINDFLDGDRIVLGVSNAKTEQMMRELYKYFPQELFITNPTSAEMIKYVNNSLLATKVSFANEIGNVCKKLGIDAYDVMDGVGLDKRLCRSFLNSGCGFGGSCFQKDVKAIVAKGIELNEPMIVLKSVLKLNKEQPLKMIDLLKKHINPNNKTICVLGLAFKPGTDDIREAPSLIIIDELLKLNAKVVAYDPKAMDNVKRLYNDKIKFADSVKSAIENSEGIMIITDWDEFKKPELYENKLVIDGRRIKTNAKTYDGICW